MSGFSQQQDSTVRKNNMNSEKPLDKLLYDLEQRLLTPEVRHSPTELSKLLADEFVEFTSSGIYDKQSIIEALGREPKIRIAITDFKSVSLAPDMALVTYRAVFSEPESLPAKHSLRSSIWKLTGGAWQMIFHQGTLTSNP